MRIINDFDIDVIVKGNYLLVYRKYYSQLQLLTEKLAQRLKIKQIDTELKNIWFFFQNTPLTILNYELLKGHKVLYGNIDLSKWMPSYDRANILLSEGTTYFLNRGTGLLIAAKYFNNNKTVVEYNKENFIIECLKAFIAMGDSILILKKEYHYSYVNRINIIQKIDYSDIPYSKKIIPCYIEALEHKVRPHFEKYYRKDLIDWWFETQELYSKFFLFYESKRLGMTIQNWTHYSKITLAQKKSNWSLVFKKLLLRSLGEKSFNVFLQSQIWRDIRRSDRSLRLSVMPLLLFSMKKDGYNLEMLKTAGYLLQKKNNWSAKEKWDKLVSYYFKLLQPTGTIVKLLKDTENTA